MRRRARARRPRPRRSAPARPPGRKQTPPPRGAGRGAPPPPPPPRRLAVAENRLHPLLARRRQQVLGDPAEPAEVDRRIAVVPDDLALGLGEQRTDRDAERVAQPQQRRDRDIGQVALQLGHEALGQPALLGHLGHAHPRREPGGAQLRADAPGIGAMVRLVPVTRAWHWHPPTRAQPSPPLSPTPAAPYPPPP